MPYVFEPVPDWFSGENEGGGIDVAALAGAASPDLVVLMVDAPPGGNRGLLRVGRVLDGDGQVTGGWSAWVDVPDWFASENQGADVVVADLDGDGRQDVVVAMVDAPPGQNQGYVRVGRGLTADGTVADGWGPWMPVPDWFSWENQGVAIALTPPDAQGARDLIVLAIDDGPQLNRGVYRIGRDLAADGTVSEWTEWRDVPGWFSWANQGCGVAIVDLDRDGGRDLVVFQVDNATGLNQAFYRVGRDLGDDAVVAGGWEPWLGVPGWFSWENQGAGLAVTELDGRRRVLVFEIDAPPGQNSGAYTLLDLDLDPARHGTWEELTFHSGVLAVHAALLPHGTVLFFAGSGSSQVRFRSPLFGDIGAGVPISVVWTPPGNAFSHPPTLRAADARPFDLFCGGDAFLADGRLLSAGGTLDYDPFKGRRDVAVFDPAAETWSFVAPMAHGRWYPTLITLGDGRVLAASGLNENGTDHTRPLETYAPAANAWQAHHIADDFPGLPLYAHLFLLADGRVFFSGGRMDDPLDVEPCVLDLTTDPVGTTPVPDLLDPDFRNQSASVILPPAQAQRVMVVGGGPVGKPDKTDATGAVSIVELTAAHPSYEAAAPLGLPRLHLNAVLLPDHTVFVGGGSLKQEDEPLARHQAEIYDPQANSWSLMAPAAVPRLYHSTALLLADGRVVAAGGNPEGGSQAPFEPPDPEEEMRLEVFSPPYLSRGPRPEITAAPAACTYGAALQIDSPQAGTIRWASLVRNGVTTHSFDSGQRLVDLDITTQGNGTLDATAPANPNIAPSGWYMLFLVDDHGVPSVARWLHLT